MALVLLKWVRPHNYMQYSVICETDEKIVDFLAICSSLISDVKIMNLFLIMFLSLKEEGVFFI